LVYHLFQIDLCFVWWLSEEHGLRPYVNKALLPRFCQQ